MHACGSEAWIIRTKILNRRGPRGLRGNHETPPDCAELQLFAQLTGSYMDGSPVVANGVVYAGSADGKRTPSA
jgi:hypothetical protein